MKFIGESPDFLSVVGFFAVCFAAGKVVGWSLARLAPPLAAAWRRGWAEGLARSASRRRGRGAPDRTAPTDDAGRRRAWRPAVEATGDIFPGGTETIVVVLPNGDRIFARTIAGANAIVVSGSDGIGIRLQRTKEAIPYSGGLAIIFRETE